MRFGELALVLLADHEDCDVLQDVRLDWLRLTLVAADACGYLARLGSPEALSLTAIGKMR
jgi:hypothetical protein